MRIKELYPNLYYVKFKSQYLMAMTFLRVQEYYESSFESIKGQYFPLEDYMDLYAKTYGNFTYPQDWSGFNIPGNVYIKWAETFWSMSDISEKEIRLYKRMLPIIKKNGKNFYIISALNKIDLEHEIAHGLYYLNEEYKKEIDSLLLSNTKFYKDFKRKLNDMGYADSVTTDEIHAYCATQSVDSLIEDEFIKIGTDSICKKVDEIQNVFVKYAKGIL